MSLHKSFGDNTDKGIELGKEYFLKNLEYAKLKTFKITTQSVSAIIKLFVIGSIISVSLLFLSIALALYLGNYFEDFVTGFLIVGFFYLVISILIFLGRKSIDTRIISKLSEAFYS